MEKVIREFRIIETDDGYRFEVTGDKEKLKGFMHGFRKQRKWRRGPFRRMFGMHGMHFGFGPMMWACGVPWDFEIEDDTEEEETEEADEA